MKFGVIGRSEWLYNTVLKLAANGHTCQFIVTSKEAPEYKKTAKDFEELATNYSVPFLVTTNLNSLEAKNIFESCEADVVISVNFSSIIGDSTISKFPMGILNAHGGDLPRYRGNACQAWALINGEDRIAMCIHRMIGGEVDTGDILARQFMPIDYATKIAHIFHWFSEIIPEMYALLLDKLERDPHFVLERQSKEPEFSLRCYPRRPSDGRIDWSKNSVDILRLINASGPPYEGAFTILDGEKIIILDAALCKDESPICAVEGQILDIDKNHSTVTVATGDGRLKLSAVGFMDRIRSIRQRFVSAGCQ